MHSICKHQRLLHLSLPWSRFPLNTTLGNKETRSSNLCSEIKHWLSNAQVLQARLWGWFDPALRWWKIRRILPNHMPEPVQLHSNSRSNHRGGLHRSSLNWDLAPSTSLAVGSPAYFAAHRESLQPGYHAERKSVRAAVPQTLGGGPVLVCESFGISPQRMNN